MREQFIKAGGIMNNKVFNKRGNLKFVHNIFSLVISVLLTILILEINLNNKVCAQQKPDFSVAPEVKSHSERISGTYHQYQINMPHDFTNHSIVISGAVNNPRIFNDNSLDFSNINALKQDILNHYTNSDTEMEHAKAVWRFKNDYFIEGEIPEINYYNDTILNFFNVFGGGICGNSGLYGPQLAEMIGLNGRTDHFDSDYLYSIHVDGKWRSFNNVAGDAYWLDRDNETIVANEDLIEDHWLHRRVAMSYLHRVTGEQSDPEALDMKKKEIWWKATLPVNDPYGNNFNSQKQELNFSLNKSESIEMKWPLGEDHFNGSGVTWYSYPYILAYRTYNNELLFQPNLQNKDFFSDLDSYNNLELGSNPKIHPASSGQLATLVIKVEHPRLLLDASIGGTFYRKTAQDVNRIFVSKDAGNNWELIWENSQLGEVIHYEPFTITYIELEGLTRSPEIHSYLIKYEFIAAASKSDAGINDLMVRTNFELNSMTLPALHSGTNRLTFEADAIGSDPIDVIHYWNDERLSLSKTDYVRSDAGVDVTVRVANNGTASGATSVKLYAGWRKNIGNQVAEVQTGQISAGGETSIQLQIPMSKFKEVYNAHIITAVVDPNNGVNELDETNNSTSRPIRILSSPEPVTIPEFITYYKAEQKVKAVIWNRGDLPVKNCLVQIYSGSESGGAQTLLRSEVIPEILRQEHYTIVVPVDSPPGIWVKIDPNNEINEQFEHNNLIFSRGTQAPLVDVGAVRTVKAGVPVTLSASVIDPDGSSITSYQWEIDAAGYNHYPVQSTMVKTTPEVAHTFSREGDYMIRLTVTDADGEISKDTGLIRARANTSVATQPDVPGHYKLYQNYPNPFNATTSISFDLMQAEHVLLKVFNMLGQEVAVLVDDELSIGHHQVSFNASGFPSGIYFYKLETNHFSSINKMLFLQ